MERLSQHAACLVIMFIFFLVGIQWGKKSDERRRRKEKKRIWLREQAKLPRATR